MRVEAARVVDMSTSNAWAEFSALFRNTRPAFLEHERSKAELKILMPEGQGGHRPRHSGEAVRSGAVSFDLLEVAHGALFG